MVSPASEPNKQPASGLERSHESGQVGSAAPASEPATEFSAAIRPVLSPVQSAFKALQTISDRGCFEGEYGFLNQDAITSLDQKTFQELLDHELVIRVPAEHVEGLGNKVRALVKARDQYAEQRHHRNELAWSTDGYAGRSATYQNDLMLRVLLKPIKAADWVTGRLWSLVDPNGDTRGPIRRSLDRSSNDHNLRLAELEEIDLELKQLSQSVAEHDRLGTELTEIAVFDRGEGRRVMLQLSEKGRQFHRYLQGSAQHLDLDSLESVGQELGTLRNLASSYEQIVQIVNPFCASTEEAHQTAIHLLPSFERGPNLDEQDQLNITELLQAKRPSSFRFSLDDLAVIACGAKLRDRDSLDAVAELERYANQSSPSIEIGFEDLVTIYKYFLFSEEESFDHFLASTKRLLNREVPAQEKIGEIPPSLAATLSLTASITHRTIDELLQEFSDIKKPYTMFRGYALPVFACAKLTNTDPTSALQAFNQDFALMVREQGVLLIIAALHDELTDTVFSATQKSLLCGASAGQFRTEIDKANSFEVESLAQASQLAYLARIGQVSPVEIDNKRAMLQSFSASLPLQSALDLIEGQHVSKNLTSNRLSLLHFLGML